MRNAPCEPVNLVHSDEIDQPEAPQQRFSGLVPSDEERETPALV